MEAVDEPRGQVDPGGDALAGDEVAVSDVAGVPHDGDLAAGGEGVLPDTPSAEDSPPPRRKQPDGHYCHYTLIGHNANTICNVHIWTRADYAEWHGPVVWFRSCRPGQRAFVGNVSEFHAGQASGIAGMAADRCRACTTRRICSR